MVARRYGISLSRLTRYLTRSLHSPRELSSWTLKKKFHIYACSCIILHLSFKLRCYTRISNSEKSRLVYQNYTLEVKPVSCWNMINLHCVKNATHLSPYCCKPFRGDSNAVKGVKIAFFCVLLLMLTLEIRYLLQLLRWIKECRPLRIISSPTWLSRTLLLHFWLFRDTLLKY